jgi:rfaE bifunctional protein nucleotidyltransferase chain/domain
MSGFAKTDSMAKFIESHEDLKKVIEGLKTLGYKIVLTQGVYDMFHTGHLRYFQKAKEQGDILVVAVDTDELTRKRKGPDRPFDNEEERFEVVRSIRTVDIVVPKTVDEDKHDVIKAVNPDVLVVSMSTGPEIQDELEELGKLCGRIENLPHQSSTTTTAKFSKLKKDTGGELAKAIQETIKEFLEED